MMMSSRFCSRKSQFLAVNIEPPASLPSVFNVSTLPVDFPGSLAAVHISRVQCSRRAALRLNGVEQHYVSNSVRSAGIAAPFRAIP
jgi:hypothetical protein